MFAVESFPHLSPQHQPNSPSMLACKSQPPAKPVWHCCSATRQLSTRQPLAHPSPSPPRAGRWHPPRSELQVHFKTWWPKP